MVHLLKDMPGAFTAFRRRYNAEYNLFDFETFAGWSPGANHTWLTDAVGSLATSQPLKTTNTSTPIYEVHQLMSTLWEQPVHSDSRSPTTCDQNSLVDLCVMSNAAVSTAPWHPNDPQSWPAANIFLARLRNDNPEPCWPDSRTPAWYECEAYSRVQTWIVGKSKCFQQATVHESQRRKSCSPVWRAGPKCNKRRVFTAPMSFFIPQICRWVREEQLKREDRRRRCDENVDDALVLPVDSDSTERLWNRRTHINVRPLQYEYV